MQLVNYVEDEGFLHMSLSGTLTYKDHSEMKILHRYIVDKQNIEVTMDLSSLSFIDSIAVGLLVIFAETVRSIGGTLILEGAQGQVDRVLAIAQTLDPFLKPQHFEKAPKRLRSVGHLATAGSVSHPHQGPSHELARKPLATAPNTAHCEQSATVRQQARPRRDHRGLPSAAIRIESDQNRNLRKHAHC